MSDQQITKQPNQLPAIRDERLPYYAAIEQRFGIDRAGWRAIVEAIFPTAKTTEGIMLALSYCKARKLDVFKRPVHIVPIWNNELRREVETVWPGIGELRTTAQRTGQYAGKDETLFGPMTTQKFVGTVGRDNNKRDVEKVVTFPAWAQVTVYRLLAGQKITFVGPRVWWLETYATIGKSDVPNDMWADRPNGQLDKCAEAAALRVAFPEEIGSDYIMDEAAKAPRSIDSIVTDSRQLAPGATTAQLLDRLVTTAPMLTNQPERQQEPVNVVVDQEPHGAAGNLPPDGTDSLPRESDSSLDDGGGSDAQSLNIPKHLTDRTSEQMNVDNAKADGKADAEDLSDFENFKELCYVAATDSNIPGDDFNKRFAALRLATKIASPRRSEFSKARAEVLAAFRANMVDEAGKIAVLTKPKK